MASATGSPFRRKTDIWNVSDHMKGRAKALINVFYSGQDTLSRPTNQALGYSTARASPGIHALITCGVTRNVIVPTRRLRPTQALELRAGPILRLLLRAYLRRVKFTTYQYNRTWMDGLETSEDDLFFDRCLQPFKVLIKGIDWSNFQFSMGTLK